MRRSGNLISYETLKENYSIFVIMERKNENFATQTETEEN